MHNRQSSNLAAAPLLLLVTNELMTSFDASHVCPFTLRPAGMVLFQKNSVHLRKFCHCCTQVFELLLGTNELLTSFDAINVLAPHKQAPPAGWLHVDQTPLRPHLACLQGLVNMVPVSADTSGECHDFPNATYVPGDWGSSRGPRPQTLCHYWHTERCRLQQHTCNRSAFLPTHQGD